MRIRLGLTSAILVVSQLASATTDIRSMTEDDAFLYRQTEFLQNDPVADRAIQLRVGRAFNNIIRTLMKKPSKVDHGIQYDEAGNAQEAQADRQAQAQAETQALADLEGRNLSEHQRNALKAKILNANLALEGKENPYNVKGFEKLFQQIISEELALGTQPSAGQVHEWSDEVRKEFPGHISMRFSKLLTCLALGVSSKYLVTGQEMSLRNYLLSLEDDSATFADVFRQSYRLNQGDVYLTLLTIENLLSANWKAPEREYIGFIKKLKPMQSVTNGAGDKFGTWYHFIGTLLYGYAYGEWSAKTVGFIETIGSQILSSFEKETQETYANHMGGKVGRILKKVVRKKSYLNFESSAKNLEASSYLNMNEDFRDRQHLPLDPELQFRVRNRSTTTTDITLQHSSQELKNCLLEIFPIQGTSAPYVIAQSRVDVGPQKILRLEIPARKELRRFRGILSQCENTDLEHAFQYPASKSVSN